MTEHFPLDRLPKHHLLGILRRMDLVSLFRLRQTTHWIDDFAEENRFKISVRKADSPWVLRIGKGEEDKVGCYIEERDDADYAKPVSSTGMRLLDDKKRRGVIERPIEQLSGVYFRSVEVINYKGTLNNIQMLLDQPVLDLLKTLRLNADWLVVFCLCTPELLSLVRFSKLKFDAKYMNLPTLRSLGILNCKELSWAGKATQPSEIFPLFHHLETFSTKITSNVSDFVNSIISHARNNRKATGTLKQFYLYLEPATELNLQNETLFSSIKIGNITYLRIYKMEIDGGVAYVFYHWFGRNGTVDIRFSDIDDRNVLIDGFYTQYHGRNPTEEVIQKFKNAADETELLKELNSWWLKIRE